MRTERFHYLFQRFKSNTCTPEEREEFMGLMQIPANQSEAEGYIREVLETDDAYSLPDSAKAGILQAIFQSTVKKMDEPLKNIAPPSVYRFYRRVAAAAVLILVTAGVYYYFASVRKDQQLTEKNSIVKQDAEPGKEGAVLILADGSRIVLDSLDNKVIASEAGANARVKNGTLYYEGTANTIVYNTISTTRGRQFRLTLPDSTRVWLNAGSSIRYPTAFLGAERKIELTGEAYFEVAANREKPFRVALNRETEITVLGTSFNVNAYSDEAAIRTTLIDGAVRVSAGRQAQVLAPGQQAVVNTSDEEISLVKRADIAQAVAWKNGLFSFRDADLETVMRQLGRWYAIEVEYEGLIPDRRFNGEIDRSLTLSQVLKGLSKTRINYTIHDNGKKIVIRQ